MDVRRLLAFIAEKEEAEAPFPQHRRHTFILGGQTIVGKLFLASLFCSLVSHYDH
jgi:hypothetical protein